MIVVEEGIVIRTWVEPGFELAIIVIVKIIIVMIIFMIIISSSSLGF